ncbi:MAG: two pore domain potassium channel family protein, partial [FCB group bacterium]|nr:two pore domain potassium channel family protein [FCB group bacterium]
MSIFRALWRKFAPPLLLGLGILLIGTTGYSIIENWSVFDSVYMTVITIAMVGFSEIHDLSHNGRVFTMFLIVAGIGTGGYAIGNLTSFLIGGEARRIFMEGMEERMLARLQNHIVILGYGKFGRAAAKEVRKQGIHV